MGSVSKSFALILTLVMAISFLSLIIVKPACAQTPSTPSFSLSTVSGSYVVPTNYSINPYNGANVTNLGYTVIYFNITVTIQNSPTASCYILEYKGHYTSQWSTLWNGPNNVTAFASSGSQTVITIWGDNSVPLGQAPASQISFYYYDDMLMNDVPLGSQIDFRLQAVKESGWRGSVIFGDASAFSAVQTVTIPNELASTSGPSNQPT